LRLRLRFVLRLLKLIAYCRMLILMSMLNEKPRIPHVPTFLGFCVWVSYALRQRASCRIQARGVLHKEHRAFNIQHTNVKIQREIQDPNYPNVDVFFYEAAAFVVDIVPEESFRPSL
jgi:hypothetical protein